LGAYISSLERQTQSLRRLNPRHGSAAVASNGGGEDGVADRTREVRVSGTLNTCGEVGLADGAPEACGMALPALEAGIACTWRAGKDAPIVYLARR
jgi:hypothetical protein